MNALNLSLHPALPDERFGEIKDMAQEVIIASATLNGRVAKETAATLGDRLRLLNSYHSNLIEGHKTSIVDIEAALNKEFSSDDDKRYSQELCAGHVLTERALMQEVLATPPDTLCSSDYLCKIHKAFYSQLPEHHLFTHGQGGFTTYSVNPGEIRDTNVSLDEGHSIHGPDSNALKDKLNEFRYLYDPANFHGDERLIAAAASHHRLSWLHPFRDGNGRVARLFSGLYLARIGINTGNLWSLSRGFSRKKQWYMINLQSADLPDAAEKGFNQAYFADYCMYFLEVCLDQIRFMDKMLGLNMIDPRIDWYIQSRDKARGASDPIDPRAAKLLKALFFLGEIPRGKAQTYMGMEKQTDRNARRIVSQLLKEGLVTSDSHRAPLKIGFPTHVLKYYFPDLFDPNVVGTI
ncbi:MAG: Fic family protein [Proteobacteria bacterium]|nr:Fic family protein [Pseudomonadota bacterium]